jgi:hypothetical protein
MFPLFRLATDVAVAYSTALVKTIGARIDRGVKKTIFKSPKMSGLLAHLMGYIHGEGERGGVSLCR